MAKKLCLKCLKHLKSLFQFKNLPMDCILTIRNILETRDLMSNKIERKEINKNSSESRENLIMEEILRDMVYHPIFPLITITDDLTTSKDEFLYCFRCEMEFTGSDMNKHKNIHEKNPIECDNCPRKFDNTTEKMLFLKHKCVEKINKI